jgi:hypothetical protein
MGIISSYMPMLYFTDKQQVTILFNVQPFLNWEINGYLGGAITEKEQALASPEDHHNGQTPVC